MPQPVSLPKPVARGRHALFTGLVGVGVGQAGCALGIALLVQRGFDALIADPTLPPPSTRTLVLLVVALAMTITAGAWLRGQERVVGEQLGQHYVQDVRATLFEHLTQVPARELGRRHRGNLLLKFVGDLGALRLWVARGLARLVVAVVAVAVILTGLAVVSWPLATGVGGVLLLGAGVTLVLGPWLQRTSRRSRRVRARLTGEVTERLQQLQVVQASGQERREGRRVHRRSERVADAMVQQARASGSMRAIAEAAATAAGAVVLLVGALEVQSGRASAGTVVAALSVTGLLGGYLRDLGRVSEYASRASVARHAARRFLTTPTLPDPDGLPPLRVERGEVRLEGVTVEGALQQVDATVGPGEVVAVVGPNGAGKSTLMSVVSRLIDPDRGRVVVDGQDLRDRSLRSVRQAVGLAGPDLPLLRGSLRRNVCYRRPRVDAEELARITRLCDLDELAEELPDGWDSDVGEGGSRLSAGQRARVTIARAALGRPPVLILDEAEAHLDARAVTVLERVLRDHRGVALVVTHRRSVVEAADRVWHLADGRLVETGRPDELLAGSGPTARLLAERGPASGSAAVVGVGA
ncbi:ABC transporter ATP-binding protein [Auraticoccus monumenti]|uniref:ATP-binding cassette, subfamily B n=1 Tax=Auraticoccus monumenti TaxID=675864 RepID=A0A1G6WSL4_9ACTN|nr:ABC transporter ATP-binding protein [Auraticoccus monumenti]SDD68872.1 ATP-binding cassette, subfamily B [Auraticoccus monumenti]